MKARAPGRVEGAEDLVVGHFAVHDFPADPGASAFQAELDEDEKTASVKLRLVSRIVRESDVRIVASRTFSSSAVSPSLDTQKIVEAFDAAATPLLSEVSSWVLSTLRGR